MKEDYEDTMAELQIQSMKDGIRREKEGELNTAKCQVIDLHGIEQEVYRRNIEACMNVLRVQGSVHGADPIGTPTRTLAETKLKEFLNKLSVMSYDDSVE